MDVERFHNELAMRLGYERIVKDKRIQISVEELEEPLVTLRINDFEVIQFQASDKPEIIGVESFPEMRDEIKQIRDAVHEAYVKSKSDTFICYIG